MYRPFMGSDWDEPLYELRHHWGSAYVINCPTLGKWTAERRDDYQMLRADSPEVLLTLIRADYTARRVPRDLPGRPRGTQGARSQAHLRGLTI
jgi:hypothetical protein